ncbi:hypothetical protein B0H16DRAFT_1684260 [Mycena metata]|uniref:Uncharacterized protein n=1 Tax=Mycena metata TaxID=1033252 RepID=A0AAD7K636_9AGAR|nr:hypothetical protein B0H16DRAFT_1684260 [Mycena metata]
MKPGGVHGQESGWLRTTLDSDMIYPEKVRKESGGRRDGVTEKKANGAENGGGSTEMPSKSPGAEKMPERKRHECLDRPINEVLPTRGQADVVTGTRNVTAYRKTELGYANDVRVLCERKEQGGGVAGAGCAYEHAVDASNDAPHTMPDYRSSGRGGRERRTRWRNKIKIPAQFNIVVAVGWRKGSRAPIGMGNAGGKEERGNYALAIVITLVWRTLSRSNNVAAIWRMRCRDGSAAVDRAKIESNYMGDPDGSKRRGRESAKQERGERRRAGLEAGDGKQGEAGTKDASGGRKQPAQRGVWRAGRTSSPRRVGLHAVPVEKSVIPGASRCRETASAAQGLPAGTFGLNHSTVGVKNIVKRHTYLLNAWYGVRLGSGKTTLAEPRTSTEVRFGFGLGSESVLNPTPATLLATRRFKYPPLQVSAFEVHGKMRPNPLKLQAIIRDAMPPRSSQVLKISDCRVEVPKISSSRITSQVSSMLKALNNLQNLQLSQHPHPPNIPPEVQGRPFTAS